MCSILFLFIADIISINSCTFKGNNELIQDNKGFEDIKDNLRPTFLRLIWPNSSQSFQSNEKWNSKIDLFPYVHFVTVNCSNNIAICSQFRNFRSKTLCTLIKPGATEFIHEAVFNGDYILNSKKIFINIIQKYFNLYPLLPQLRYTSSLNYDKEDGLLILHNSKCTENGYFFNSWLKIAHENSDFLFKFFDCSLNDNHCSDIYSNYDGSNFTAIAYISDPEKHIILNSNIKTKKEILIALMKEYSMI